MYLLEVMQLQWENIDGAIAKAKLVSTLLFLLDLKKQKNFLWIGKGIISLISILIIAYKNIQSICEHYRNHEKIIPKNL